MNRKKHHSIIELVEQARLQSQINQNLANELIQSIEEEKKRNNASFLLVIKNSSSDLFGTINRSISDIR